MKSLRRKLKRIPPTSYRDWLMFIAGIGLSALVVGILFFVHNSQVPVRPEADTITSPWVSSTVKHWERPIDIAAKKYNVDPNLIAIIMTLESDGYAKADSGEAVGLMQITPATGKDIARKFIKEPRTKYDLKDPQTSIEFGTAYIAWLRDEFGSASQGPSYNSTVELIAAGYNGGPGAANSLEQGKGLTDAQTIIYSRDAFNMWRERHNSKSPTYDRWLERGGSTLLDEAKKSQ